ncbi:MULTISPECIES: hypothetical protein [Novipirellula]|uniref:hypothetical protein n=1 Tax=Novipirellula TaxID=2795426 RepID=UPI0031EB9F0A
MQHDIFSFPDQPCREKLETARMLIRNARNEDERSHQEHLRQRVQESLGEHANKSQVTRLILRPLSGHEDDLGKENGLEIIIGAILSICGNHAEVARHGDRWLVYTSLGNNYILRRCAVTWLSQMSVKHKWSLIADADDAR